MTAVEEGTAAVGFRSERGAVLVAVMSTTALVALDSTVLATAVPTIVKEIGGFSQFPWLFSIYLLTSAVATPLFGRLADTHGRRPVLLLGIAVFLLGSVICAVAPGMGVLIAGRAVQGIGAGAVQPVSLTIVGDLYSVAERARVQGYLASVWGMSAVVGPAVGGLFSQYASWRWIFVVNLPVGIAAAWLLLRSYHETITRTRRSIDVAGALALVAGWSLVLLGLLEGGVAWAWNSPVGIGVLVVGVLCLVAFVLVERRAAEPVVPLWVFRRPVLVGGALAQLGVGALLIGLDSYVPVYAQGVLGAGAVAAGFALATMTIGWPLAATFSGRLYLRIGFRDTALAGGAVLVAGFAGGLALSGASSLWAVAAVCFVAGVGLGLVASPTMVAVQSSVTRDERGLATGTAMFSRSLGSAVGVGALGAVVTAVTADRLASAPPAVRAQLPAGADAARLTLRPDAAPDVVASVREALATATHDLFGVLAVVALATVAALLLIPRRTGEPTGDDAEPAG
ncbi:MAG TPA: MFS transporter [Kineosporiaceae bacterium]|nr:MFS transporter [Kineosporiaceae bacterium]